MASFPPIPPGMVKSMMTAAKGSLLPSCSIELDRVPAVFRTLGLKTEFFQHGLRHLPNQQLIIHDQDPTAAGGNLLPGNRSGRCDGFRRREADVDGRSLPRG